ncbi:hypothetical protein GR268_46320, partial [Rhizobium leguminosarum]|nr:hypothetical protein [Rhizobium leguminosarum]
GIEWKKEKKEPTRLAIRSRSVAIRPTKLRDKKVQVSSSIAGNSRKKVEKKPQQGQNRALTKATQSLKPQRLKKSPKTNLRAKENQQPKLSGLPLEEQADTDWINASTQSDIEVLPVELLKEIFSYLTFKEMLPVRGVNRFFYALTTG